VAFLLVFCHHLLPLQVPKSHFLSQPAELWNLLASWGWVGVELFFVLSAFLITTLLLKERETTGTIDYKAFLLRRALRVWPLYFVYLGLNFIIAPSVVPELIKALPYYCTFTLNYLFTTPQFKGLPPGLILLWSISVEEQFYVVWGFLLKKFQVSTPWIFAGISLLVVGTFLYRVWLYLQFPSHNIFYYNTFAHLDSLLVGIGLALLATKKVQSSAPKRYPYLNKLLFIIAMSLYLLCALSFPGISANDISIVALVSLASFASGCFFWAVLKDETISKFFTTKPLVALGKISYGLYIWHFLALYLSSFLVRALIAYFYAGTPNETIQIIGWFIFSFLALFISILFATLSWHLLEKPFNALRQRFQPQIKN
jgi:peptidoglycan/LPS O-acetylase OafA/YrhL